MKIVQRLGLLLAALLVSACAAELLVRGLKADRPVIRLALTSLANFTYDPALGWRHLPHVARTWEGAPLPTSMDLPTNAQGFRAPFDYTTARSTKPRLALVGDSQVFGFYVGDNDYLGAALAREMPDAEIYSFGVPGYGPPQELLLLEQVVLEYRPDAVVLVVFVDNDLIDTFTPIAYGLLQRPYVVSWKDSLRLGNIPAPEPLVGGREDTTRRYLRPRPALFAASAVYRLLLHRASIRPRLAEALAEWDLVAIESVTTAERTDDPFDQGFRLASGMPPVCTFMSRCPAQFRFYGIGAAAAVWARMKSVCEERGVSFFVLVTPPYVDLEEGKPNASTRVAAALVERGIETIRFFDELLRLPIPTQAVAQGMHWNEATTVSAASAIRARIEGTLPSPRSDVHGPAGADGVAGRRAFVEKRALD